jgi:type III pantothenate kinase
MADMVEQNSPSNLIAVDIGNSQLKAGQFRRAGTRANSLPEPIATLALPIVNETGAFDSAPLATWCEQSRLLDAGWLLASVHRAAAARLTAALTELANKSGIEWKIRQLTVGDVPLKIRVEEPARVGIDRLLAALAANRLRQRDRAAIIVDLGTAITVDLLEADGTFAGGAILPGIAMSARALEEQTDALPRVALDFLEQPPAPLGASTEVAIESGLYWGSIGAIRELIAQLAAPLANTPDIFVTGGASAHVARLLSQQHSIRHAPNLVLSGIALVQA